jgi:hypothetical protein
MSVEQFNFLASLDFDAVQPSQVEAISSYADLWLQGIAPNQPIRMNGNTVDPELGQTTFSCARAVWNAIE